VIVNLGLAGGPAAQLRRRRLRPSFRNQKFSVSRAERQAIAYRVAPEIDPVNRLRQLPREHNRLDALIRGVVRPSLRTLECARVMFVAKPRTHGSTECNAGAELRTEGWITAASDTRSAVFAQHPPFRRTQRMPRADCRGYWQLVDTIFTESTFSLAIAVLGDPEAAAPAAGDADASSIVPVISTLCPTCGDSVLSAASSR
jgi:hypothetical protein